VAELSHICYYSIALSIAPALGLRHMDFPAQGSHPMSSADAIVMFNCFVQKYDLQLLWQYEIEESYSDQLVTCVQLLFRWSSDATREWNANLSENATLMPSKTENGHGAWMHDDVYASPHLPFPAIFRHDRQAMISCMGLKEGRGDLIKAAWLHPQV
jgi:hypothetical protein